MSRVYEAHDRRLARRVAVKLLGSREGPNSTARERLLREAELYARIEGPRTPGVYEVSSLGDGTPYVVMEYVVGQSLAELLGQEPPTPTLACEITAEILSALCSVHGYGVVHRDVKPSNIILEQNELGGFRARLVDFGIAKASYLSDMQLTQPGALLGTPQYMAPEQLSGLDVDARADLYAAGLVFYEMLVGTGPHRKSSLGDLVAARMRDDMELAPLIHAGVPATLAEFLRRALARDPEARFGSAEEMLCELHAARAEQHCVWASSPAVAPMFPSVGRLADDPSHPPRPVLDVSGLHSFAEDDFEINRRRRRSRAVRGLLAGFGLTFATGIWLLQPQLRAGLHTEDGSAVSDRAALQSPGAAPVTTEHAPQELLAKPAVAASPDATPADNAPPASALARGAFSMPKADKRGSEAGPVPFERRPTRAKRVQETRKLQRVVDSHSEVRAPAAPPIGDGVPPNPY